MDKYTGILKFVIGVTGHRDCLDLTLPVVEENLITQLHQINETFSFVPVELVSGLAEGADILAAKIALEQGISVHAILPMPLDEYKKDFTKSGLESLEALIVHPGVTVSEIPLANGAEIDRDAQYMLLEDFIVRRSNVLIALWDNEVTGLAGGTSDVILEYLSKDGTIQYSRQNTHVTRTVREATDGDDGNLVIVISTPRVSSSEENREVKLDYLVSDGSPTALARLSEIPPTIRVRWSGFDNYARDRNSDLAINIQSYDLWDDGDHNIDDELFELNQEFIRADQLAVSNQKFSNLMFKGFGLAAGAMGLCFLVYAKLAALKIFLIVYLILFVGGYFFFKLGKSRSWFSKHLAYRAFSEAVRVKYYLIVSGCSGMVASGKLLKHSRINRFKGCEWIVDAIKCSEPIISHRQTPQGIESIRLRWIDDQSNYFIKNTKTLHKEHKRLENVKKLLFFASFLGTGALLLFKGVLYDMHIFSYDGKTLLVFLMGLLPLWLALWELYQNKLAIRELSWQYSNQQKIFSEASRRMAEDVDLETKKAIIKELAENSLSEIFMWTVQRFHRDHEPPAAG